MAVIFVDGLGYATVIPLLPFVLRGQGASPAAIGAVFAAFSLCQLVTAPLLGSLSDRIGRRTVLGMSQIGSVIGFGMLALSSTYPIVLLSRIIDGSSAGNVSICYAAVVDTDDEDERRRGIPALGAAGGAGILAGIGLSALLAGFGLRAAAVAAMLLTGLSLLLTITMVPETRRRSREELGVLTALRQPELRRAGLFVALSAAVQAAFFLTLPAYLGASLGLRPQGTIAVIAGLVALAAAFQLLALPQLLARLGGVNTGLGLLLAASVAAVIVALNLGHAAVVTAAALLATSAAALAPVSALLLAESRPDAPRGLVMGLNSSSATAGQFVGPLAGYAAFQLGAAGGLGVACIGLSVCAALGLRMVGRG